MKVLRVWFAVCVMIVVPSLLIWASLKYLVSLGLGGYSIFLRLGLVGSDPSSLEVLENCFLVVPTHRGFNVVMMLRLVFFLEHVKHEPRRSSGPSSRDDF